jgi:DNA (cytosine-5)-methyltransferase 1
MPTKLSLCCGIGGEHIGLARAGFRSIGAIDKEPYIAALFKTNFGDVTVGDLSEVNPSRFKDRGGEPLGLLWASPNCQNFSKAKNNAKESESDVKLALAICKYIAVLLPRCVALENVEGYVGSTSFNLILKTLIDHNYLAEYCFVESADFGLPQKRKRLIIRGALKGAAKLRQIEATHSESGILPKWKTWFDATEHLLFTMEKSTLLDVQSNVMPPQRMGKYAMPMVIERRGYRGSPRICYFDQQMWTVKASLSIDGKDPRSKAEREAQPDKWLLPDTQRGNPCGNLLDIWVPAMQQAFNANARFLAALQGFPPDYIFTGQINIDGRGIGNAVGPPVAEAVAKSFQIF